MMVKFWSVLLSRLVCVGCGEKSETTAQTPKAAEMPTYRVASLMAYPPFSQSDAKGGVEGFDMDIINYIAEKKGFKVVYQPQGEWAGILEGLDEGKHDLVAAGVFVTPARQEKYGFSDVYMSTGWMLALKDETAVGKANFTDFDKAMEAQTVFATEFNAPVHSVLQELLAGRDDVSLVDAKTPYMQLASVLQGKAQAAYDSQKVFEYYLHHFANDPKTKMYGVLDNKAPTNYYAFAVKKGNDKLIKQLNDGLQEMKANGKFQELEKKWFGKVSQ